MDPVAHVELGRIRGPYGVKGWVHVESFTEPAESLLRYRNWTLRLAGGGSREARVSEGRRQGRGLVARLEGIEDRESAARLAGATIEVPRGALPPTGEREYYRADLIGLAVRNVEGAELGVLQHFVETAGNAVMVVRGEREHWVPATPQHIRKVDLEAGTILVDWPAELE